MIKRLLGTLFFGLLLYNLSFSQCAGTTSVVANPQPNTGGTYAPGQVVTFCFSVTGYTQTASNWFHGLTFTFGPGWDPSSFTVVSAPSPASGSGSWDYYPNGETSSYTGQTFGPGFYFGTSAGAVSGSFNGDPGQNFGDDCASPPCTWTFCFTITVSSSASPGTSLSLTGWTTGDGTSGSWSSSGCGNDPITNITPPGTSVGAPVSNSANVTCHGGSDGSATAQPIAGSVPPYTYRWSTNPVQTTQTATNLIAGTYTCTITDGNNVTTTVSETVTEPPAITYTSTVTNPSCYGLCDGSVSVTVAGGTPGYTYAWNTNPTQTGSTATGLCSQIAQITITDANSCTATGSFTLNAPQAIAVTLANETDVLCYGQSTGAITVSVTGGHSSGPLTYTWSAGSSSSATNTGLGAGSYAVTVTDTAGCTGTGSFNVNQPVSAISLNQPIITNASCNNANDGAITASATGGTPGYTYNWAAVSTAASYSGASITNLPADSYNLTATDANACSITATYTVGQPNPVIINSLIITNVLCNGGSDGTATVDAQGGNGTFTYAWSRNSSNYVTVTGLNTGPISVTVTDGNGCSASATDNVAEPTPLAITLQNQGNITCSGGNNGILSIFASGGAAPYSYYWSNGSTSNTASGLTAGAVGVTVTDGHACTTSQTYTITEPTALTVNVTGTDALCFEGADGSLTADPNGGMPPYTYAWSDGQTEQTAKLLVPNSYLVTVTDNNNCTVTGIGTVNQPTDVLFTVVANPVKCIGQKNGTIDVFANGGIPPYNFSATQDFTNFVYATNGTISGLDTGSYHIIVSDNNGCTKTITDYVANATPNTFNTTTDSTLCYGSAYNDGGATILATSLQNGPYQYSIDNGSVQDTGYFSGLAAGLHTIYTFNKNGCEDSVPVVVLQPLPIVVRIVPDSVVLPLGGSQAVQVNYLNATNPSFMWDKEYGLSCIDCYNPTVSAYEPGEYMVTVSMVNGEATCYGYAHLNVQVLAHQPAFIPNAFSPNGDGNNDVFQIYGENIKLIELKVFNRWGELVYQTNKLLTGWDGTYRGQLQSPGVFSYIAKITYLDDTSEEKNGSITLIH